MIWFVEERGIAGNWTPCLYHGDKPTATRISAPDRVFRADPVKVPDFLDGLDGMKIGQFLSPDGEFHGLRTEGQIAVANMLRQPGESAIYIPAEWWSSDQGGN
ncbi:hypothetical protein [Roseovarius sp. MMSF_3350]|uniref:hypothetical protein n=1 Tax=Roseovarius sp. MMSF_3350 TaxID=3046706 RepID=UPI00273E820A|nr:hypothetical protein [Roseovarius sp. MMSF_3350]